MKTFVVERMRWIPEQVEGKYHGGHDEVYYDEVKAYSFGTDEKGVLTFYIEYENVAAYANDEWKSVKVKDAVT